VEPDRAFPRTSETRYKLPDPVRPERVHFDIPRKPVLSYALVAMRPTMIRWLNETQNFMLVFQFMHTYVGDLSREDKEELIEVPGLNDWKVSEHSFTLVFATFTQYLHGMLTPKLVVAYLPPGPDAPGSDWGSGFTSFSLAVRLSSSWRMELQINDFFGADAYKSAGLFRDRDEINLSIMAQF